MGVTGLSDKVLAMSPVAENRVGMLWERRKLLHHKVGIKLMASNAELPQNREIDGDHHSAKRTNV